jgi:hypothetical protein
MQKKRPAATGGRTTERRLPMKSLAMTTPERATGHRIATWASWALPGVVLAGIPKCPACFAAYAALWTGVGMSMSVASNLRSALMLACIASLAFLFFRQARRAFALRHPDERNAPDVGCCEEPKDTSQGNLALDRDYSPGKTLDYHSSL